MAKKKNDGCLTCSLFYLSTFGPDRCHTKKKWLLFPLLRNLRNRCSEYNKGENNATKAIEPTWTKVTRAKVVSIDLMPNGVRNGMGDGMGKILTLDNKMQIDFPLSSMVVPGDYVAGYKRTNGFYGTHWAIDN